MRRWGLAIVFIVSALVALSIAFADLCEGFRRTQSLAAVGTGVCLGGLILTLLSGRFLTRPSMPWAAALVAAIVVPLGVYVIFIMVWVGECSR